MTVKRMAWIAFWLFLLFMVVQNPETTSSLARAIGCRLEEAATQVTTFLSSLAS